MCANVILVRRMEYVFPEVDVKCVSIIHMCACMYKYVYRRYRVVYETAFLFQHIY